MAQQQVPDVYPTQRYGHNADKVLAFICIRSLQQVCLNTRLALCYRHSAPSGKPFTHHFAFVRFATGCSLPEVAEKASMSAGTPVSGRQIVCPAAFKQGRLRCHTVGSRQTAIVRAGGNESNGSQEVKKPGVNPPGLHSSNVMLSGGTEPSCLSSIAHFLLLHCLFFSDSLAQWWFSITILISVQCSIVLFHSAPFHTSVDALNGRGAFFITCMAACLLCLVPPGPCNTHSDDLTSLDDEWWSTMQFGYTRKDVILLGGGIFGVGYGLYYGLQAAGYDALVAGNIVQIFVFLGIGVGYISTYIFRVANKVRAAEIALRHQATCMLPVCLDTFLMTHWFLS